MACCSLPIRLILLLLTGLEVSYGASSLLNPGPPIEIGLFPSDYPSINGSKQGFVVGWLQSDHNPYMAFSPDGTTWDTPVQLSNLGTSKFSSLAVRGVDRGFMSIWANSTASQVYGSFSSDPANPHSWSAPMTISSSANVRNGIIGISGRSDGFLVGWNNSNTSCIFFFYDITTNTWETYPSLDLSQIGGAVWLNLCRSGEGFLLTTFSNNGTGTHSSFLSDLPNSQWVVSPSTIETSALYSVVGGDDSNCMITWIKSDGTVYTAFSDDSGATWDDPIAITGAGEASMTTIPSVTRTDWGFVVAWHSVPNILDAAFLLHQTSKWVRLKDPVGFFGGVNENPSVAGRNNTCVFSWNGKREHVYASFSKPKSPSLPSRGIFRPYFPSKISKHH